MSKFKSPKVSPGHRVCVSIRRDLNPVFYVSVDGVVRKFATRGAPTVLGRPGKYSILFEPPEIERSLFYLAVAILEAQLQFVQVDYPHIYSERMADLAARDRAALTSAKSWHQLSSAEADELRSTLVRELNQCTERWRSLKKDLVAWAVQGGEASGPAGRIRALLTHQNEDVTLHAELDAAYEEYKRIYRRVYEVDPVR